MANRVVIAAANVNLQSPSALGFPGSGGNAPQLVAMNINVRYLILENLDVWLAMNVGTIGPPNPGGTVPEQYDLQFFARDQAFTFSGATVPKITTGNVATFSNGDAAKCFHYFVRDISGSGWMYQVDGQSPLFNVGDYFDDLGRNTWTNDCFRYWHDNNGNGHNTEYESTAWTFIQNINNWLPSGIVGNDYCIWVGGTATYAVNAPVYPTPVRFPLGQFAQYINYRPWSVRSGTTWHSCDRPTGQLDINSGAGWQSIVNSSDVTAPQRGYTYNGTAWERSQRTGV